jgi:CspA family cold shock protein
MARIFGRVAWFDTTKGYGFLSTAGHNDVYCHYSAIKDLSRKPVTKGQAVEFETIEDGARRARATKVMRLDPRSTRANVGEEEQGSRRDYGRLSSRSLIRRPTVSSTSESNSAIEEGSRCFVSATTSLSSRTRSKARWRINVRLDMVRILSLAPFLHPHDLLSPSSGLAVKFFKRPLRRQQRGQQV